MDSATKAIFWLILIGIIVWFVGCLYVAAKFWVLIAVIAVAAIVLLIKACNLLK